MAVSPRQSQGCLIWIVIRFSDFSHLDSLLAVLPEQSQGCSRLDRRKAVFYLNSIKAVLAWIVSRQSYQDSL